MMMDSVFVPFDSMPLPPTPPQVQNLAAGTPSQNLVISSFDTPSSTRFQPLAMSVSGCWALGLGNSNTQDLLNVFNAATGVQLSSAAWGIVKDQVEPIVGQMYVVETSTALPLIIFPATESNVYGSVVFAYRMVTANFQPPPFPPPAPLVGASGTRPCLAALLAMAAFAALLLAVG